MKGGKHKQKEKQNNKTNLFLNKKITKTIFFLNKQ